MVFEGSDLVELTAIFSGTDHSHIEKIKSALEGRFPGSIVELKTVEVKAGAAVSEVHCPMTVYRALDRQQTLYAELSQMAEEVGVIFHGWRHTDTFQTGH